MAGTGGGAQLVTVVDPSRASLTGTFTAWARTGNGCWSPVSFAGQPAQPFRAQTGYGGLLPIAQRVPGDCIFLHDDMPQGYTEGCVALPHAELDAVLGWLNPADTPHILIAVS